MTIAKSPRVLSYADHSDHVVMATDTGDDRLPEDLSARRVLSRGQVVFLGLVAVVAVTAVIQRLVTGTGLSLFNWIQGFLLTVTVVGFVIIAFRTITTVKARSGSRVVVPDELAQAADRDWPRYRALVPVFRAKQQTMVDLITNLMALNYPVDRLKIVLLVERESEDSRTRSGIQHALESLGMTALPPHFEVMVCPERLVQNKPSACNIGLGDEPYTTIWDQEDAPEPLQLRKAVMAFEELPPRVVCLQAELRYHNADTNWLTKQFAAEYSFHFRVTQPGIDRMGGPVMLGGTSNHFITDALVELGGWDPYNNAEDADWGVRAARRGWETRMFNSSTLEEANSRVANWIGQRSRWIKGFIQTWLVHMRSPLQLWRELGTKRFLSFQLMAGWMSFINLVNPLLWVLTGVYVAARLGGFHTLTDYIDSIYPPWALLMGDVSLVIGNALIIYYMMIGCAERGLYRHIWAMLTFPAYAVLMSLAAFRALGELCHPNEQKRLGWFHTEYGFVAAPEADELARLHDEDPLRMSGRHRQ